MKITVITVCRNEEHNICKTLESVLCQTYANIEYIIQDGLSTDGTMNVVNSYKDKFVDRGIDYKVYSEKDTGIYNAMNMATQKATGKYVVYMNAGDEIDNCNVLQTVVDAAKSDADVIYGKTNNMDVKPLKNIVETTVFGHQAAYIKTSLIKEYKYSENLKIAADYEFFLKSYLNKKKFLYVDYPFAKFQGGGISGIDYLTRYKNLMYIKQEFGLKHDNKFVYNWKVFIIKFKMIIKKILPKKIVDLLRRNNKDRR